MDSQWEQHARKIAITRTVVSLGESGSDPPLLPNRIATCGLGWPKMTEMRCGPLCKPRNIPEQGQAQVFFGKVAPARGVHLVKKKLSCVRSTRCTKLDLTTLSKPTFTPPRVLPYNEGSVHFLKKKKT